VSEREPSPAEPLLRTLGMSKRFGPVVALDQVSFEVRAGEVLGLLGDNGAGKSHAFQVADRLVVLRHGRVAGERRTAATTHEEIVALVTGDLTDPP
jgi:ABC-type sugar transport system ATPase subunit